jgi:hypothetical protein
MFLWAVKKHKLIFSPVRELSGGHLDGFDGKRKKEREKERKKD